MGIELAEDTFTCLHSLPELGVDADHRASHTELRGQSSHQQKAWGLGWAGPGSKEAIGRAIAHSPLCLRGVPGAGCEVQKKTGAPIQSIRAEPKNEALLISLVRPSVGIVLR